MASRLPRLTLYSKAGTCSLCDIAKDVLQRLQPQLPHTLDVVDISLPENKEWFRKYKFDIPVLHLEGKEIMRHRIDPTKLQEALQPFYTQHQPKS